MGNSRRPAAASAPASDLEVGFAKLQGEDFEYYMQTYSIILGRHSRKKDQHGDDTPDDVDVDLGILGGGMNVSRRHARIFYDFVRRRFALEVLGKNGCLVEGVLHEPGSAPVKLDSQDLLQMGDAQFYFLLPSRSVFDTDAPRRAAVPRLIPPPPSDEEEDEEEDALEGQEEAAAAAKRSRNGDAGGPFGQYCNVYFFAKPLLCIDIRLLPLEMYLQPLVKLLGYATDAYYIFMGRGCSNLIGPLLWQCWVFFICSCVPQLDLIAFGFLSKVGYWLQF
jgi:hypothetical protein